MNKFKQEKTTNTFSVSILTILTAVFIVSKVFEIGIAKDWSWWWVFSPIWLPLAVVLGIIVILWILKIIFIRK